MLASTIPIEFLYALIPIALIQIVLELYALYDWLKQGSRLENRFVWLILIFVLGIIGPLIYFWKAPRESLGGI